MNYFKYTYADIRGEKTHELTIGCLMIKNLQTAKYVLSKRFKVANNFKEVEVENDDYNTLHVSTKIYKPISTNGEEEKLIATYTLVITEVDGKEEINVREPLPTTID